MYTIERQTLEQHRGEWAQSHPGEWVVLDRSSVIGFYPNLASALEEGFEQLGRVEFFVSEVRDSPTPLLIPAFIGLGT